MWRVIVFILFLVVFYLTTLFCLPLFIHLTASVIGAVITTNSRSYWLRSFLAYDQFINTVFSGFLNWLFHHPEYSFGHPDETVSSVLGKNIRCYEKETNRSIFYIDKILTILDGREGSSHSIDAIEDDENVNKNS